jgi:hypothetical protein
VNQLFSQPFGQLFSQPFHCELRTSESVKTEQSLFLFFFFFLFIIYVPKNFSCCFGFGTLPVAAGGNGDGGCSKDAKPFVFYCYGCC